MVIILVELGSLKIMVSTSAWYSWEFHSSSLRNRW